MKTPHIYIVHTFYGDSEELNGLSDNNVFAKSDNKFYAVELNILGGHLFHEFMDIHSVLEHSKNHNLVYRYIESINKNETNRIMVLHEIIGSDRIVGYHNFYGIGADWKLYVNSKSDIVVQHIQFPKNDITVRFRDFPTGNEFYVLLSCLIYIVTNYKLETEMEIRKAFNLVKEHTMK